MLCLYVCVRGAGAVRNAIVTPRRAVEHMVTVTYATGRHPQGSATSFRRRLPKRMGLLIPGSAGDAASARRRVAGNLYAINATSARWRGGAGLSALDSVSGAVAVHPTH